MSQAVVFIEFLGKSGGQKLALMYIPYVFGYKMEFLYPATS